MTVLCGKTGSSRIRMAAEKRRTAKPCRLFGGNSAFKISAFLIFLAIALILTSCTANLPSQNGASDKTANGSALLDGNSSANGPIEFYGNDFQKALLLDAGAPRPLRYNMRVFNEVESTYPYYIGANSAALNTAVFDALSKACDYASESFIGKKLYAECAHAFENAGLVSFFIILYEVSEHDEPAEELERVPFNYDIFRGLQIGLDKCFGDSLPTETAAALAEKLNAEAQNQGYTLLSRIDPPNEKTCFVFGTNELGEQGIYFYYRQYEIALPSQGCPLIFLPCAELAEFAEDGSPVARLYKQAPAD